MTARDRLPPARRLQQTQPAVADRLEQATQRLQRELFELRSGTTESS